MVAVRTWHIAAVWTATILVAATPFGPLAFGESQFAKPIANESFETIRVQAVDAYNSKRYEEAEKLFFELVSRDSQSAETPYALEYLKKLQDASGNLSAAIRKYHELKTSGVIYPKPEWLTTRPKSFESLQDPRELAKHLASLFKLGGLIAARTSLLGFILDGMNLLEEANYYESQVSNLLQDKTPKVVTPRDEKPQELPILSRPLYHLKPAFIATLELPIYSVEELQEISFPSSSQLSDLSIQSQSGIDRWETHANIAYSPQYDSNGNRDLGRALPFSGKPMTFAQDLFANVGSRKSIVQPITYGWDYSFHAKQYNPDDLKSYNALSHIPSIWASWWNGYTDEFNVQYNLAYTLRHDVSESDVNTLSHGPQFAWSHLWNQRYKADLAYSATIQHDAYDATRDGLDHLLLAKVSYPGISRKLRPYLQYSWERDVALGDDFNISKHSLFVGTSYLLGVYSALNIGTGIEFAAFPQNAARTDHIKVFTADYVVPIYSNRFSISVGGKYFDQTSTVAQFSYQRVTANFGLISNFGL